MLVVSDTSPLNYLVLIEAADVLRAMYGRVVVPPAVARELAADGAPPAVRTWFAGRPDWVEVRAPGGAPNFPDLDAGEAEAIALATELGADLLLIDERKATEVARRATAARTTGTLGVLLDAAGLGLVDLAVALRRLEAETTFRAPSSLYRQVLDEHRRRGDAGAG